MGFAFAMTPGFPQLEVESYFSGHGARRNVMRAAEGGEEIVEHVIVREVHRGELQADFVLVAVQQVVFSDGGVEEMARRDARRVVVVILLIRSGQRDQRRCELRYQARVWKCLSRRGANAGAGKSGFELFVGGHERTVGDHGNRRLTAQRRRCRAIVPRIHSVAGRGPSDLSAVIAPTEGHPGTTLPRLVLHVSRLIEFFVMIDAEGKSVGANRRAQSAHLRREKARGHARENNASAYAMNLRHAQAASYAGNL